MKSYIFRISSLFILVFCLYPSFTFSAIYYVNNNSTSGDTWCTAVGNNSNNGTSANTPKLTISNVILLMLLLVEILYA